MSMPVQEGPGGPLGYAWSRARQKGRTGASAASPLQGEPPQIVTSLQDGRDRGASPSMPSSRNALHSRGGQSLRDALSSRDSLAAQDSLPSGDTRPPRSSQSLRGRLPSRDALHSHDAPHLRPTLLPEPPLAPAKTPAFASTAWLRVVALAAGGALGFLWVTPANQQGDKAVALVPLRETPGPAAQSVAAGRAPGPSEAAEQAAATGAALYQEFLKWLQLRGR
jgi:hypothetical protein